MFALSFDLLEFKNRTKTKLLIDEDDVLKRIY